MVMTVTDYSGLGPAMSNIAQLFINAPNRAVEADLMRQRRAGMVAQTALDEQQFKRDQWNLQQAQDASGLYQDAAMGNAGMGMMPGMGEGGPMPPNMLDVIGSSITLDSTGNVSQGLSPADIAGNAIITRPNYYGSEQSLSNALLGSGLINNAANTPVGQTRGLQSAERTNAADNAAKISEQNLAGLQGMGEQFIESGPGGPGTGKVRDVSPAQMNEFVNEAKYLFDDIYPGAQVAPAIIREVATLAAERYRQTGNAIGAVDEAARSLGLNLEESVDQGKWGEEDDIDVLSRDPSKDTPFSTVGAPSGGSTSRLTPEVLAILQHFGLDLSKLGQMGAFGGGGQGVGGQQPPSTGLPSTMMNLPGAEMATGGPSLDPADMLRMQEVTDGVVRAPGAGAAAGADMQAARTPSIVSNTKPDPSGAPGFVTMHPQTGEPMPVRDGDVIHSKQPNQPDWVFVRDHWEPQ